MQPPESLKQFQSQFSTDLRTLSVQNSAVAPARPGGIYEQLLFNNLRGFIDKCFPVAQTIISPEKWLELEKSFYRNWHCQSPVFQNIPYEFYEYILSQTEQLQLPRFLPQLMHYEWLELDIDLNKSVVTKPKVSFTEESEIYVNPTLVAAHYQWPVHTISQNSVPEEELETHLLVFRNYAHSVNFIEINAMTAALVKLMQDQPNRTITDTLETFAATNTHIDRELVLSFGKQLIVDLIAQNAVIVTA